MSEKSRTGAMLLAVLTCPCHVALLPLLLGGTALGTAMQSHLGWVTAGFAAVFVTALAVALRSPRPDESDEMDCCSTSWEASPGVAEMNPNSRVQTRPKLTPSHP